MTNSYFLNEMKELLGEEFSAFEKTLENKMYKSLRINTARTSFLELNKENIIEDKLTPFNKDTYYIEAEEKLGNHPFHVAGMYYLQEPAATMAVSALGIEKGDKVLDLCAAPGGKSTQILNDLAGTGFLWSNELNPTRARALLSNLERWGFDNYILTNMSSEKLAQKVYGYFDKVIVDAPCSGASMFKKYPQTIDDYNLESELACQRRQLAILEDGYKCLKNGGTLVYSTCTYNLYENEDVVKLFLERHPSLKLVDTGDIGGRNGFNNPLVARCFPMDGGEGHFVSKFIKNEETTSAKLEYLPFSKNKIVDQYISENCVNKFNYSVINNMVYASSKPLLAFNNNVLRQGILIGEIVKNRLEPHHHGFTAICLHNNYKQVYELKDDEVITFMTGNTLLTEGYKGYVQIRYKGHAIGFGKGDGKHIKNKFPKGLRLKISYNK